MPIASETFRRLAARRLLRGLPALSLAVVLLGPAAPSPLSARPAEEAARAAPAAPAAPADSPEGRELRRLVEQRYQVLPIHDGVLLTPHTPRLGVRSIELRGNEIAVNGERVAEAVLRAWLGEEDAGLLLALQRLSPAGRRALFGLELPAEAPEGVPPAGTEPGEEIPEGEEIEIPALPAPPAPPVPTAPPALPDVPSVDTGSRVKIGGGVTVGPEEVAQEVFALGGPVRVQGEVIDGVAAVGGSVWIDGPVGGSVVSVGGSVHLGPKAVVEEDVVAVMGRVVQAPGAKVHGDVSEVSGWELGARGWDVDHDVDIGLWPFVGTTELFGSLLWTATLVLLAFLTLALAPRRVEAISSRVAAEPWRSAGSGLLAVLAFLPLLGVVTVLTCCLFVVLLPFVGLAAFLVILLGYTAAAHRVGLWSQTRFNWRLNGPYAATLAGLLLLEVLTLIGNLLGLASGPLDVFALMFVLAGSVVHWAALCVGIGGFLLDWFERRRMVPAAAYPVPAVPPAPPATLATTTPPPPPPPAPPVDPGSSI